MFRKKSILFISFFIVQVAIAQDQRLLVIYCSEGVTADRTPLAPGNYISDQVANIKVPKGGYVGVLSAKGIHEHLTSTRTVASILGNQYPVTGAVRRDLPEIELAGQLGYNTRLYGDTITLQWRSYQNKRFVVTFSDLFDDNQLAADTVDAPFYERQVKDLFEKDVASFKVLGFSKGYYESYYFKKIIDGDLKRVKFDLSRIPSTDASIYRMIIFDANELYYDFFHELYHWKLKNGRGDNFFDAYLNGRYHRWGLLKE